MADCDNSWEDNCKLYFMSFWFLKVRSASTDIQVHISVCTTVTLFTGHQCSWEMKRRWRRQVLIRELVFLLSLCSLFWGQSFEINSPRAPPVLRTVRDINRSTQWEARPPLNSKPAALPPHLPPVSPIFVLFSLSDVFVWSFRYFRQRTSVHVIPVLTAMPSLNWIKLH